MESTVIKIGGMTCQGCVQSVTKALQALPGVHSVEVSLAAAEAAVQYDPATASPQLLRDAVEDAGFDAL